MTQLLEDTITARATPPGTGGIGIVRVSGPQVRAIAHGVLGSVPRPRQATVSPFLDDTGDALDYGVAFFFKAPASYTGEDVLELHGHGGVIVIDQMLARVTALGARLARPGEFTERAFLNGKLDLAQAEAVADLIDSQTTAAARCALRSLRGDFSQQIGYLSEEIGEFRVYVEANIDFSDEPVAVLESAQAQERMEKAKAQLSTLLDRARPGALLARGVSVVLSGAPNVGKSSLLNALARMERAIVSATPGTTRDLIEATVDIDGLAVCLTDTAGLRHSADEIEAEGVRRASAAIETADLVLELIDDSDPVDLANRVEPQAGDERPHLFVLNKCDLSGRPFGPAKMSDGRPGVAICATTGQGIASLEQAIKSRLGYVDNGEDLIMARRRHLDALERAMDHLNKAQDHIGIAVELLAEELRLVQQALGEITGEVTVDDLLGQIFSSFCIGK